MSSSNARPLVRRIPWREGLMPLSSPSGVKEKACGHMLEDFGCSQGSHEEGLVVVRGSNHAYREKMKYLSPTNLWHFYFMRDN